jgi:hypothetical protein
MPNTTVRRLINQAIFDVVTVLEPDTVELQRTKTFELISQTSRLHGEAPADAPRRPGRREIRQKAPKRPRPENRAGVRT